MSMAGLLLAVGGIGGGVLVATSLRVPPAIWNGPATAALPLIAAHGRVWQTANAGFVVATVLTAAGMWLLPAEVGANGGDLAIAAAVAFALAGALWLVTLALRLWDTPSAAASYVASGTLDPSFTVLSRLGGVLFAAFILVASGSLVGVGAAIVLGGAMAAVVGWITALAGLAIGVGYLWLGDTLPAFVYLPTTLIGIALLVATS